MRMKKGRKTIAIIAIMAVCFGLVGVYATETKVNEYESVAPFWTHIAVTSNNIQDLGGGRLRVEGSTQAHFGFRGAVTVELQQNGRTIQTWNATCCTI